MRGANRWMDVRPLRASPTFRRLWIGTSLQSLGRQITVIAVLYQVWEVTGSSFWVGFVGLVYAVPTIVLTLIGGSLADVVDRKKLILWTTCGALFASVLLALQAASNLTSLPLLLGLVCLQTAFTSLGSPARRTVVVRILPQDQVGAGIALSHISFQASMLIGPALAGLLIAWVGLTACYAIEALCFGAALYGIAGLPSLRPIDQLGKAGVSAIIDGMRFIRKSPPLSGSFLSDLAATLLAMPIALFPAMNEERFAGSPETLGLFLSAIAVGGIAASALSGLITSHSRPGIIQLGAAAAWGAALAAVGLVDGLLPTLLFLAAAGAADTIAVISRGTLLQLATPDNYRGRVSAVENVVGIAGPELGNFRAGIVASIASPAVSLTSGGILCVIAIASIAARNKPLTRYRT